MTAIVADALVKEFGDVRALDGLSLDVQEGEFFGLLPTSGYTIWTTRANNSWRKSAIR